MRARVKGKEYSAYVPDEHSRIEKMVYETWWKGEKPDVWAWNFEPVPNKTQVLCYVKYKGDWKWTKLYEGPSVAFALGDVEISRTYPNGKSHMGVYPLLFELETDFEKKLFLKKRAELEQTPEIQARKEWSLALLEQMRAKEARGGVIDPVKDAMPSMPH